MKRTFLFCLLALLPFSNIACNKEDPRVVRLEAQLQEIQEQENARIKAEEELRQAEETVAEQEQKEASEKEKAELRAELEKLRQEKALAEQKAKETPAQPARPKFGPGNGNTVKGYSDGYLRIHTNSAEGKLTLRNSPDQNGDKITLIPNGEDGIYYFNKVKIGEYVWYEVEYYGQTGWLRGDYVSI
jgi:hypothetical protein